MAIVISLAVVLLVVIGAAWAARHVRHPESTASHDDSASAPSTSDVLYGGSDRPAGPDAEDPLPPSES